MAVGPSFMPPPHEFSPTRSRCSNVDTGFVGAAIRLSGRNFNVGEVAVRLGDVDAPVLSRSPSSIEVTVPNIEPGCYALTVITGGGTVISHECFEVVGYPVIQELDPFGFNRSPEGGASETLAILGQRLLLEDTEVPSVTCCLTPRFDPSAEQAPAFITLEILSKSPSCIMVEIPPIPDFSRYVGGTGHITLSFPDGSSVESDSWEIDGL